MLNNLFKHLPKINTFSIPLSFLLASQLTNAVWASTGLGVAPVDANPLKLTYKFNNLHLAPGEEVYLELPDHFQKRPLDFAFITHMQHPQEERECYSQRVGSKIIDCLPAYTSFEVLDANAVDDDEKWRHWGGGGSGPLNSKFAEVRVRRGETDNLYEWRKKGHVSVVTGTKSKAPLVPEGFRVRSIGRDSMILQEVVVKFLPPPPNLIEDYIFSDGFAFGDYETAHGRRYPGNPSKGNYGDSLDLHYRSRPNHYKIPSEWIREKGSLVIPLIPGKKLLFVDVAAGDMGFVPYGADPEPYRGGARISIQLDGEILADAENIGTNGVLRASPADLHKTLSSTSELIIHAPSGTAHIMGIRLCYED